MTLAVRTLAHSDDLLGFGPRNIMKLQDGPRILRFDRGQMVSSSRWSHR